MMMCCKIVFSIYIYFSQHLCIMLRVTFMIFLELMIGFLSYSHLKLTLLRILKTTSFQTYFKMLFFLLGKSDYIISSFILVEVFACYII